MCELGLLFLRRYAPRSGRYNTGMGYRWYSWNCLFFSLAFCPNALIHRRMCLNPRNLDRVTFPSLPSVFSPSKRKATELFALRSLRFSISVLLSADECTFESEKGVSQTFPDDSDPLSERSPNFFDGSLPPFYREARQFSHVIIFLPREMCHFQPVHSRMLHAAVGGAFGAE